MRVVALDPRIRKAGAAILGTRFLVGAARTTTPLRFLTGEVFRRGMVETYYLRSGMPVALQHGRDAEALFELFVGGEYEPPAPLADRLASNQVHTILDVGANVGMFSAWAAERWPDAEITAFEPVESNCAVYRLWARRSGARVELVEAAAGTAPGDLDIIEGGAGSHVAQGGQIGARVPVVDLFEWLDGADLVKIDIEGGEWPILADPRLAEARATIVMEYHRLGAPSLPARDAARALLHRAGFATGYGAPNHWGHGTLWAWKDRT